jgi:quercetin 2,3-dioxygenase
MITAIGSVARHFSDFGWLKTYWLFSFANYYDPANTQFGALRVFNDDVVEPDAGFPTHPHREMEIVTIPLSGQVTHADSMGNRAVIEAGDVQRMSAGTGLTHSEFNLGEEPCHFFQIWLTPDEANLAPSYDQRRFSSAAFSNRFCPVASGQGLADAVTIHTDATIYRSRLEGGQTLAYTPREARRIFLYLSGGDVLVNGVTLGAGDQARIDRETKLVFTAQHDADLVLIDVAADKGRR